MYISTCVRGVGGIRRSRGDLNSNQEMGLLTRIPVGTHFDASLA